MVKKLRRIAPAEQPRELDLAAGRGEEVVAADHQRHALHVIVNRRRELIGPVAVAILDEQIAALLRGLLRLLTVAQIDESFDGRLEPHAHADAGTFREPAVATRARISEFRSPGTLKGCPYGQL